MSVRKFPGICMELETTYTNGPYFNYIPIKASILFTKDTISYPGDCLDDKKIDLSNLFSSSFTMDFVLCFEVI